MAIKIVKKKADEPAPAEVVEGGLTAKVTRTAEDSRRHWESIPPPNAKRIECKYCRKYYLRPCTEAEHAACQNFFNVQLIALERQKKEKSSADVGSVAGGEDDRAGKDVSRS